jgi:hypothetical protein
MREDGPLLPIKAASSVTALFLQVGTVTLGGLNDIADDARITKLLAAWLIPIGPEIYESFSSFGVGLRANRALSPS